MLKSTAIHSFCLNTEDCTKSFVFKQKLKTWPKNLQLFT